LTVTQRLHVVHSHVHLFTNQYKLVPTKGGDALKLGRKPRASQKVMTAYCWAYDKSPVGRLPQKPEISTNSYDPYD